MQLKKGGVKVKSFYSILAALGAVAATLGTQGCILFIADEPKMPKNLLNK